MKPGDVVSCSDCGSLSLPASYSGALWQEGWPLLVTWKNGPHPRHALSSRYCAAIERCSWCDDKARGFPALTNRPLPREVPWVAGGPAQSFEIPAVGADAPGSAGEGPLNDAQSKTSGESMEPGAARGNKAPLERFAPLAAAFHAETGLWPPGKDNPAGVDDEALWKRWREWCAARAAAAAPKPKPRGQLGLGF
jgi:hypothetical protein